MTVSRHHKSVLLASAAFAALAWTPVTAQEGDADTDADTRRMNQITVTATRREESIQDVPIAVTAVSPEELQRQGVKDLRTLGSLSASFNLNSSQTESQGTTIRIRGVGTTGNNIGLESAVGVFLDGVYLARPGIALGDLVDLEQIEVLRGPQGTLFGRNTSAGALNITTRKPDLQQADGFANFTYGNLGQINFQGGFGLPVIQDQLGIRISGAYRERDGILTNPTLGTESGNRDRFLVRGQALWEPTDNFSFRLIGDYSEADEQCCDGTILFDPVQDSGVFAALGPVPSTGVVDPTGGVPFVGLEANEARLSNGFQFQNPFEQWGISGQVDWDLGFANLTYIGAYRDFFASSVQESDFTGLQIFSVGGVTGVPGASDFPAFDDIKSLTQELRLQGLAFDGRLDWLIGGFYSDEEILEEASLTIGDDFDFLVGSLFGGAFGPAPIQTLFASGSDPSGSFAVNRFTQDSTSWSIFTHNTFAVTDQLDFTVGLRWVDEQKDGSFTGLDSGGDACFQVLNNAATGVFTGDPATDAALAPLAPTAIALTCFPFSTGANLPGSAADLDQDGIPDGTLPTPVTFSDDPGELGVFVPDFEDEELVYTIKAGYAFTPDINAYASFTHGFKAGGFNLDSTAAIGGNDPRFDSETVDAYEVGVKSTLFDGRVRANVAVFHQELSDFQVLEFTGIQFETFNVDTALATGFEVEVQGQVTNNFSFNSALTFSDARYPDDCATQDPADPDFNINAANLCGADLTNAPLIVGLLGLTYEDEFNLGGTNLAWFGNANVRYESDRRTSTQPTVLGTDIPIPFDIQESNAKVNLRVGIGAPDGSWQIEGWAVNLTDQQTRNVTFDVPLRTGSQGSFIQEPRTYGVTLRTAF
ncbi:MAG: TonB-dependent receptor [Pseudomonadota bacterium]